MFKSIDETDKFSYEDCVLTGIEKAEDGLIMDVEALIVRENNSQNTNFTESYAGPTAIKFVDGKITDIVKAGFKYYDADGRLIKEVPDEPVVKPQWESLIKTFDGNYLPALDKGDGRYTVEIEMSEDDGTQGNSYLLNIEASGVVITWDRYLNRVGR
ncbi:MAG: hypothetical protein IK018_05460 [Lachnospiraceae bacterium]|nr:hypothetical protein [Lachnospiraceae bacterium]